VIAKIEWHPAKPVPQSRFIVTIMPMDPDWVVALLQPAGTAEQHTQGRQIRLPLDRGLSAGSFRDNSAAATARLAYKPGHLLALHRVARAMADWSV